MKANISIEELDFNKENVLDKSEFLYTTHFWIKHLVRETKGEPVLLKIAADNSTLYFVGVIIKKYGIRICGSPFEGWSTPYMGFIGIKEVPNETKIQIIKETVKFLKRKKKCAYIQICDWNIDYDLANSAKFKHEKHNTYLVNLSPDEETLFKSFKGDVRTNCRNFLKRGAKLSIVEPSDEFALDHYNQLVEVFDKQGLQPFYSSEKIRELINDFKECKDYILCENVYEPENNKSIATGIFFGYKGRFYFFGAASLTSYQILRPNEYVLWNAMRYWKSKGCTTFDMLGIRKYKEKFSPEFISIPVLYFSKIPFLHFFKILAKRIIMISRKK